ncbi:MAG: LamG-like jellyroll fold domain-containing protein [Vibrio cyclitrophicus]
MVYSDDAMVDDTWYHVVVVRESGVLRVYMDAVEQASTQTLSGEINSNGTVRVSRDNSNTKHIE